MKEKEESAVGISLSKSRMRKIGSSLLVIALLAITALLAFSRFTGFFEIKTLNENSSIPFDLASPFSSSEAEGLLPYETDAFGFNAYTDGQGSFVVHASAFPDVVIGRSSVTSVSITSPEMNVLGISPGAKGARENLEAFGYRVRTTTYGVSGSKGKISVCVYMDEGVVTSVCAELQTSNLFRVQF